jgi:antitoxin HicB
VDERDDKMTKSKRNPHWGSTLNEFLDEEGIREAAKAEAVTRVVAWQLSEEMKRQGITKARGWRS